MTDQPPTTPGSEAWDAELARRQRTLALARKHAGEQGTKAAWRTVYNAENSISAWEAIRPLPAGSDQETPR